MEPEAFPGISWRPISVADLDALTALHQESEAENNIPYRTSRDELAHQIEGPDLDPQRHTRLAVDADGCVVASIWVMVGVPTPVKHRALLMSVARRDHAHLESAAIRWAEQVARSEFATRADELPRVIRAFLELHETARIRAFENEGFEVARYFVDMVRPLDAAIPEPSIPDGISIEPWSDRWVEPTHGAHVEAFADHWGSLPPTIETWRHWVTAPNFRPDLSFVAVAGEEVAAYAINGVYPDDFVARGRREGWIDTLGTRRGWRRQGLASALLARSMEAFAAAGLEYAALGVDTANPTGAFGLYAALGFEEVSQSVTVLKDLAT